MRGMKAHPIEIWAKLSLSQGDQDRVREFLVKKCGLKARAVVQRMHLTVYHSRRPMRGVESTSERAAVSVPVADTRFMVMTPGGENPRPGIDPMHSKVGIRIHKQSAARPQIYAYRQRLLDLETPIVLGARMPSTLRRSAFGARTFQPHMTLLRPGSGISRDLSSIGVLFRQFFDFLMFDEFSIEIVPVGDRLRRQGARSNRAAVTPRPDR